MRSKLPPIICLVCGFILLIQFFIPWRVIQRDMMEWVSNSTQVVGVFGLAIGLASLVHMHGNRIKRQAPGWGFSIITLTCAVIVALIGLVPKGCSVPLESGSPRVIAVEAGTNQALQTTHVLFGYQAETAYTNVMLEGVPTTLGIQHQPMFDWFFNFIFQPLTATTFSLLAFYMITATYRAVRIKSWEAGILLFAAIIVLLGQVPIEEIPLVGPLLTTYTRGILFISLECVLVYLALKAYYSFRYVSLGIFAVLFILTAIGWYLTPASVSFEEVKALILQFPNTAAKRGIIIGIALGGLATGIKIIFGVEKPYMGGRG